MWQSSNPTLTQQDAFNQYYGKEMFAQPRADIATLSGVVNKTGLLVLIAIVSGGGGYALFDHFPPILWVGAIVSFLICLGIGFVLAGRPQLSPVISPIYAIVEGAFLGAFTALADRILESKGLAVAGGVGVQAFIITAACAVSMLGLYKAKILRPTRRFQAVVMTLTGAVFLAYLVSFVLSFFGMPLPLISFASAVSDHGMIGLLGLGINLFILILASLWLIIDFGMVEEKVAAGSPKYMEWYCGFALLVTLAWIYFEAVKLVVRLAVLFGGRD
jgi:uncharacterized YccA/Bax inhibitor family protein